MNDLIVTTGTCPDCLETGHGLVILCPKHAATDRLIEALGPVLETAEMAAGEWEWGTDDCADINAARALLDELKQAQGTQMPETK